MFKENDRVVLKEGYVQVPMGSKGTVKYIDDPGVKTLNEVKLISVKFDDFETVLQLFDWRLELIKENVKSMIDDSEMYVFIDNDSLQGDETFDVVANCGFSNETYDNVIDHAKEESEYNEQDYIIYKLVPVAKVEFKKETIVTIL
jgi:hypothetical protein